MLYLHVRRRASKSFTYPRFGPLFLRTSSYAQSCDRRLQVPHVGLVPSHRSFLFRHSTQAMRFCLLAASSWRAPGASAVAFSFKSGPCCDRSLKKLSSGDSESAKGMIERLAVPSSQRLSQPRGENPSDPRKQRLGAEGIVSAGCSRWGCGRRRFAVCTVLRLVAGFVIWKKVAGR